MAIRIPTRNTGATHCTAGLSGYPAEDFSGVLGENVYIGEPGSVIDAHLIPWRQGFGGWTFYFLADSGAQYFVTHLDESFEVHDGRLAAGALVGRLTRDPAHAALINGAHVHVGNSRYSGPGLSCGVAAPLTAAGTTASRPPTTGQSVLVPSGDPQQRSGRLFVGWGHLRNALGFALRASLKNANVAASDTIRRLG
jgi:hypothetical protein